tara:strand:- start:510 stop:944 length:435 start_codon:yes stop_codon:yes gene_type:complete
MKKYKSRKGSRIPEEKAQIYGERLELIKKQKGGKFKPADVVDDARKKSSPLHNHFEWDDNEASKQYRLQQARYLVSCIVEVMVIEGVQSEQRSFFSVKNGGGKSVYVNVETALETPDYRTQLLNKIINHLENTTTLMKLFKSQK